MLRKSVLVVLCTLLLGPAWSAYAADPSLAGWWKLDETSGTAAADSSGNGNNGTVNGTATWVAGMIKGGLQFDGSTTWVDCGGGSSLKLTSSLTIAAWIKINTLGTDNKIAGNQDNSSGGYKLCVYQESGNNFVEFEIRDASNASTLTRNGAGGTALKAGVWYHVAGVYNKGVSLQTFVNGVLDRTLATASVLGPASTGTFKMGREPFSSSYFWNGVDDDVAVFSRALTAAELTKLMKGVGATAAAANVSPVDKATDVPRDATLNWTAGPYPATHDVYLGTTLADVNTASRTAAKGVLVSQGQADTTFDPPGSLAYGQTYYWRIDEVNKSADGTVYKGDVWSFTAEPYAYPIAGTSITATASSAQLSAGPENTINGSGLDAATCTAPTGPRCG